MTRRTVTVSTKVSPAEQRKLLRQAEELGMSPAEYYRYRLLATAPTDRLRRLFEATYRASVNDDLTPDRFEEIVEEIDSE